MASWLHHNTFRSGDRSPISGGIVDLVPILDDVCLDCDADELHVTARLANQGRAAFRGEVALTLIGQTTDGEVILDTTHVEGPLAPGRSRASVSFDIGGLAARNLEAVALRVEGAGTEGECDTDNNRATWPEPLTCP